MIKNMLLIVLPNVPFEEILEENKSSQFNIKLRKEVPLGVLSIASYINKFYKDLKIRIIDLNIVMYDLIESKKIFNYKNLEEIFEEIIPREQETEEWVIGLSAIFNTTYSYLHSLSAICKKLYSKSFVFAGGGLPSNLYEIVLKNNLDIDAVCIGEGEIPILELLESIDFHKYLNNSNCWVTREKLNSNFVKEFKFIHDLDEIPPLNFGLIPFEQYSNHAHNQNEKKVIAAPLMFSRGCPFNCCFCASHSIHGKKVRYNSIDRIKYDIKLMVEKYNVNTITVWDDNFFVNKNQAIDLLDFFLDLRLDVEFVNGFPVYRIDDDIVSRLKNAGVTVVTLAIESGNSRVLKDIIHKPLKLPMVEKAIECLRKYDMYVKGLFVIGLPGETLEDIQVTIDFIDKIPINWVDIFIASPVAGSELFEICKENKYINMSDLENFNFWKGSISTPDFTPEQIQEIQLINVLKKDFVNNYDMIQENYETALKNFEYVIKSNPENPFAYYYSAIAAKKLSLNDKADFYEEKFKDIIESTRKWDKYMKKFDIKIV